MIDVEIKNRFNGNIIITGKYESVKDALEKNSGVNLECANLQGANLEDANLEGANLEDAKNISLPIFNISGTRHPIFAMDDFIKIGCEKHLIKEWLEDYKTIGTQFGYTDEEITEYYGYIQMIAKFKGVEL